MHVPLRLSRIRRRDLWRGRILSLRCESVRSSKGAAASERQSNRCSAICHQNKSGFTYTHVHADSQSDLRRLKCNLRISKEICGWHFVVSDCLSIDRDNRLDRFDYTNVKRPIRRNISRTFGCRNQRLINRVSPMHSGRK